MMQIEVVVFSFIYDSFVDVTDDLRRSRLKHLLLVEDNPSDEMLAVRALKKAGLNAQVTVVRDGQEAIDYLFATGEFSRRDINDLPDVVLLDLNLPKLSGFQVLERIRNTSHLKDLPVIVVSSSCEDSDVSLAKTLKSNGYVQKPIEHADFQKAYDSISQFCLYLKENCGKERCARLTIGCAS